MEWLDKLRSLDTLGVSMVGGVLLLAWIILPRMPGRLTEAIDLDAANLQGCRLHGLDFTKGVFRGARMQGAGLFMARMDESTNLAEAIPRGASVKSVDDTTIAQLAPFWTNIFADGTIAVPDGNRASHWDGDKLEFSEFMAAWHGWQRTIGMAPENPE